MLFLFLGDVKTVANLTNFTIFAVFIIVNAAVIYFRYKKPTSEGFKSPISIGLLPVFPVLGLLSALFMMLNIELMVFLVGIGVILLGFVFHYLLRRGRWEMRF
jgi:APA family basic amino acid/polyamine antiporter